MQVHIRVDGKNSACCGSRSQNYVVIGGPKVGSTPWPWVASDPEIFGKLCSECRKLKGVELAADLEAAKNARKDSWLSIPESLRLAISSAYGGNGTVIRCSVPGYSSRLSSCIDRMCRELGYTKQQLGTALLEAGITGICGTSSPMQWASVAESTA